MSEPTLSLHDLLRRAKYQSPPNEILVTYPSIAPSIIAAIQKQIEDAATAPLRAEVDHWVGVARKGGEKLVEVTSQYYALKARADALRLAIGEAVDEDDIYMFEKACAAYDAAGRAGETPDGNSNTDCRRASDPVRGVNDSGLDRSVEGPEKGASVARDHEEAVAAPRPTKGQELRRAMEIAFPGPTDAAAEQEPLVGLAWVKSWIGDFGDGLRAHEARLDDLVTRADAATSRLDMHMRRLDDFQHWREGVDRQVKDVKSEQWNAFSAQNRRIEQYRSNIEQRVADLEAARTTVPVVTDAMVKAYLDETQPEYIKWMVQESGTRTIYHESVRNVVRAGIAAALKAAGGAK